MEWFPMLAQVLAPGGIAALAIKMVLNGSKQKIDETHSDVKEIKETLHTHDKRITILEVVKG